MRSFLSDKIEIIPLLIFLDILILILTALIRPQYVLFHIAEIVFSGILIIIFIRFHRNKEINEENLLIIFYNALLVFSILWLGGVLLLNRIAVELQQDFSYALLLIIFFITILIFILISLREIMSHKQVIKSSPHIIVLTWIVIGSYILLTTFFLAPTEDVSEIITNINGLF
ncbi:MAG: hypothetical protein HeimC3_03570 [Candidatus Heimdallarchaeota archaeon LC_3]|nr:MAG: hypothetical protein HeimC3_03570 [Candidatus Heimdallarchaeota archaeon LC_3]